MRNIKYIVLILLLFLAIDVNASTKTYPRVKGDNESLGIRDWVNVNSSNENIILKTPKVDEAEKVYDFADLFSDQEEKEIFEKVKNYIELSNYDLAVVTINENNKYSEVEYADDFYDYNNFGFNDSRDGMLFLIDMDNRRIYISTTGYAIKMYDDYRIDMIIDAGYTDLKNAKYASCILEMIDESVYYYNMGIPSSNEHLIIDGDNVYYERVPMSLSQKLLITFASSGVITLIVSLIMYFKTRLKIKVGNLQSYFINAKNMQSNDQFLRSAVTRVPIHDSSSSSGGGGSSSGGGGSSFHSSSSGSFHGGGGRGF